MLRLDRLHNLEALPPHARVRDDENMLEELQLTTREPSAAHTFYVAHAQEPSPADQMRKLDWLKRLASHIGAPPDMALWVWIDVVSLPAWDHEQRGDAARSILCYSQVCSAPRALR